MTTTPAQTPSVAYTPSGSTTGPFTTPFGLEDSSQLTVFIISTTGVATALTITTDYTVSAVDGDMLANGASVTLEAGAVPDGGWAGARLALLRVTPTDQLTDYDDDSGFQPTDVEYDLNKIMRILQEHGGLLARAVLVQVGDTAGSYGDIIQDIINQIIQLLEGEDLNQTVIDAVLANLTQIINLAATELQALINALEAQALALVPIVYATDVGEVNDIVLVLDPAPVEADLAEGFTTIVKMANANTGATSITVNDFGPFDVVFASGEALESGTLKADGSYLMAQVDADTFQLVGVNKPAAIEAGDVDFGLTYDYATNKRVVRKDPAVGGFQWVEVHGTVTVNTDEQLEVTLPISFANANQRYVSAGSNSTGPPGAGVKLGEAAAYFTAANKIKVSNDQPTCEVTYFARGKVAV